MKRKQFERKVEFGNESAKPIIKKSDKKHNFSRRREKCVIQEFPCIFFLEKIFHEITVMFREVKK